MRIPAELKYTEEHEWVRLEGDIATVGVTDYAQDQLTDVVFVELPEVGRAVQAGEAVAVLESVKSVSDVYAPVAGEITAVNSDLEAHPERVNEAPYEGGWLFQLKADATAVANLLDDKAYQAFLDKQDG